MRGVDDGVPPPTTSVFLGEITTDLVLRGPAGSESAARFARMNVDGPQWARQVEERYVQARGAGFEASVHPGGSAANAAAAFVATMPLAHRAHFVCAAAAPPAPARLPLWWPGYSTSAADLAARGVRVWGHQVAARMPDIPGAVALADLSGRVIDLVVNAAPAIHPKLPAGDLLVARSDHVSWLDRDDPLGFACLGVLLADDQLGWDAAAHVVARATRAWVFGSTAAIAGFLDRHTSVLPDHVTLVGTDGAGDCVVRRSGDPPLTMPVAAATRGGTDLGTDLGAGDAYLGGFLGRAVQGASPEQAHQHGCAAAAAALRCRGARPEPDADLNHVAAGIDRTSNRTDEGRLFFTVRRSPGVTVVTGGQTGVDTVAAQAACAAGLPVHLVLPAGRRREDGPLPDTTALRLHRAGLHELGSGSFRYRTWASVYLADAVILLDRAGGEGSAETRRAAATLHRPLLDLRHRTPQPAEVTAWLGDNEVRVVLVAGSRASLIEAAGIVGEELAEQVGAVITGVCAANATRLRDASAGPALQGLAGGPRADLRHALDAGGHRRAGVPWRLLDWLGQAAFGDAECVVLSPSDLAIAFARHELDAVVTWPSLLPTQALAEALILPLGCFAVHYGFLQRTPALPPTPRVAVQYEHAWRREGGALWAGGAFGIDGSAEAWLAAGLADIAYDSWRTGVTAASFGLQEFYPTHWDSASLIWRDLTAPVAQIP